MIPLTPPSLPSRAGPRTPATRRVPTRRCVAHHYPIERGGRGDVHAELPSKFDVELERLRARVAGVQSRSVGVDDARQSRGDVHGAYPSGCLRQSRELVVDLCAGFAPRVGVEKSVCVA